MKIYYSCPILTTLYLEFTNFLISNEVTDLFEKKMKVKLQIPVK